MAAQASRSNRRMDRLAFALVFMALQAFRGIHILVERNRMRLREGRRDRHHQNEKRVPPAAGECLSAICCQASEERVWRLREHCQPMQCTSLALTGRKSAANRVKCKLLQRRRFHEQPHLMKISTGRGISPVWAIWHSRVGEMPHVRQPLGTSEPACNV